MAESPLECRSLACGYPDRAVLAGIDFQIERGEVVALLGPNGVGKSTLLKTILSALGPLSGSVWLSGQDGAKLSHRDRAKLAAYTPQDETPPFEFSAREIVLMGRTPHSEGLFESAEDLEAAREAMRRADCLEFADRPIDHLSGGERQRVLIARALAQDAPLLLLDEPTAHLDPGHQLAVAKLLRELAAEGQAVLAAVHDLNWASSLSHRCLLLHEGRLSVSGPTRDVLESPNLEEAFQVKFARLIDSSGTLRVFPQGI